jgi:hydroxypyruvate isomerase
MTRLAANISLLWSELDDPAARVAAARHCGFAGVECQFPYSWSLDDLARAAGGIEVVLLNAPPGDLAAGERGLACLPGREADFRASIEEAARWASSLGCRRIHVLAGAASDNGATYRYIDNLGWAADRLVREGIDVLIEPLNRRDFPGYLLGSCDQAARVIGAVGRSNVKLQFDTYHVQILEGDLLTRFVAHQPLIGHVQIAGPPDRHEPDRGEVDHHWLLAELQARGWDGWVGAEYRPAGTSTEAGLGWAARYGITAS